MERMNTRTQETNHGEIDMVTESKSRMECRQLTHRVQRIVGTKTFGPLFGLAIDSASSAICQWRERGTGPLSKMRELLIHIEKEADDEATGRGLIRDILNFLGKPFKYFVVESLAANQGPSPFGVTTYLKGYSDAATELAELFAGIQDAKSHGSPSGEIISFDEYVRICDLCDESISSVLALREHVRREFEGGSGREHRV